MPDLALNEGKAMLSKGRVKIITPLIFVFALIFSANAEALSSQGRGQVNIKGEIVATACAISTKSREQTIDMGNISVSDIYRRGQGNAKAFSIELINCTLETQSAHDSARKYVQLTFDGNNDNGLFQGEGRGKGVAIRITDHNGNVAIPGVAMPLETLAPGNKMLNYFMTLVAVHHPLKVGGYFFTIRFRLDYL
ncbi:fimbrial protein [Serratia liquefaciens]|uniref:fimbrial protein n=1 Tax=Serratia liquefaciens TaxID=614 RepID=UPI0021C7FA4C|nr:fimbrial protein [Serratia liquefaciens]